MLTHNIGSVEMRHFNAFIYMNPSEIAPVGNESTWILIAG
jgi:hypothetical protein